MRHRSATAILLAVLLILAGYAQMMGSVRVKSATYDEQTYYARGYAVFKTGDMRLRLRHPLLTNLVSALPLLLIPDLRLPTDHRSWTNAEFHEFSAQFLWEYNAHRADQIVFLSRWSMMLVTVVMWAFVYRWADALFGRRGALLALTLVTFCPNILAHGRLANTDIGATAAIFIAAYAFWMYQRRRSIPRLLLAGVACGLAQTTRFTAMLLFPVFGVQALLTELGSRNVRWWRGLVRTLLVLSALIGISLVVIVAVYGFSWGPVEGTSLVLPSPDHWGELLSLANRLARADRAFLAGRIYEGGWWPYFFVVFLVKTPLPTLALAVWAGACVVRQRAFRATLPLLLPVAAFFGAAVIGNLNTGYRLILPILPFLAVHAGRAVPVPRLSSVSPRPLRLRYGVLLVLVLWLMAGTLAIYPDYLAYFNEIVGPRRGYRVLVDSNIDWGQDLPGLRSWMDENGVDQVYLSWFGIAPPEHYGVQHRPLPGWPPFENPALRVYHPTRPLPGVYAVSAMNLQGVLLDDPDTFAYFRGREPVAIIGHSIFVYEVPATGESADLALGGVRFDELPAGVLESRFAGNDLRLRWFDHRSSLVLMPSQAATCYAIASEHPISKPLEERFLAAVERADVGPGLGLYGCPGDDTVGRQLAAAAESPIWLGSLMESDEHEPGGERIPPTPPVAFGDQLAFLGYELLTPAVTSGQPLNLLTYWRVLSRPEQHLRLFVHLRDDHGQTWGQHDGLGVPVEGWHPGDVIVQQHTFAVAEDAPRGRYWLETGVYDPQTMIRLPVVDDSGEVLSDRLSLSEVVVE